MSKTYALITGASSGIGLEIARQLAARRMHLTLVARSGDVLEEVARELTERFGVDVRTAALDLSESDGWGKLERLIEEDERELTLLVNNAGVGAFGSALDVPEERVRTMLRLSASGSADTAASSTSPPRAPSNPAPGLRSTAPRRPTCSPSAKPFPRN